jgi:coproporphyrinogen III oxidase
VGGIFFDYVDVKDPQDFGLLLDVGQYAARAYAAIVERRKHMPYDEALIEEHQFWRGRYAEFNLVYDRGTRFGLLSGGHYKAIFCSLPPLVRW